MKCISCGNEIPEGSTSCPFCGNTVLPTNHSVITSDSQMNDGVPTTPEVPVLPQDQNLGMQDEDKITQSEVNMGEQEENVQDNFQPNINVQSSEEEELSTSVPSISDMEQPIMGTQMITNQGELTDGMKIASTSAPIIEKKKRKNLIIIIVVMAVIIAIVAGLGIYYYMSQYKTANKRIDAVFSGINTLARGISADKVELKSGSYEFSGSVIYGDTSADAKVSGTYGYDLEKKIMDYTLNISSLNMKSGGQDVNLIDKEPLKLEVYTADSKAYVLLENFYENYIYSDIEGYDELLDGVEQNEINYSLILQGIINAMKSGLKAASNTQTVKNVTLDGKSQKANVVTINLNKENQKRVVERTVNNLKNNTSFLEEVAKLMNASVDDIKTSFDDVLKDVEYTDETVTMEIITNIMGTSLLGIHLYDNEANMEILPIDKGIKLSLTKDDKDVLNLTYTSNSNKTSTSEEESSKLELTGYIEEKVLKVSLESNVKDDVNPKVEKVNTKNSVSAENIGAEDQQKILNNIYNYGTIGLLLQSYLGDMTVPDSEETSSSVDQVVTSAPIVNQ